MDHICSLQQLANITRGSRVEAIAWLAGWLANNLIQLALIQFVDQRAGACESVRSVRFGSALLARDSGDDQGRGMRLKCGHCATLPGS